MTIRCATVLLTLLACTPKPTGPTPTPAPAPCETAACGPAMGMPNSPCPDGVTMAGPSGRCMRNDDGSCGWEVIECPPTPEPPKDEPPAAVDPGVCAEAECGPQMGMPNTKCADGKTVGGPSGRCLRKSGGGCSWEVIECPPAPP